MAQVPCVAVGILGFFCDTLWSAFVLLIFIPPPFSSLLFPPQLSLHSIMSQTSVTQLLLKFCSYNVKGLNIASKRGQILNQMQKHQYTSFARNTLPG